MPTHRQFKLLDFIRRQLRETGVSPSYEEMAVGIGVKSKSNVFRILLALEEQGFVKRLAHRARAVEIVKWPKDPVENEPSGV